MNDSGILTKIWIFLTNWYPLGIGFLNLIGVWTCSMLSSFGWANEWEKNLELWNKIYIHRIKNVLHPFRVSFVAGTLLSSYFYVSRIDLTLVLALDRRIHWPVEMLVFLLLLEPPRSLWSIISILPSIMWRYLYSNRSEIIVFMVIWGASAVFQHILLRFFHWSMMIFLQRWNCI